MSEEVWVGCVTLTELERWDGETTRGSVVVGGRGEREDRLGNYRSMDAFRSRTEGLAIPQCASSRLLHGCRLRESLIFFLHVPSNILFCLTVDGTVEKVCSSCLCFWSGAV